MSVLSTSVSERVSCPDCGQLYKARGLKIHAKRRHGQLTDITSSVFHKPACNETNLHQTFCPDSTMEFGNKLAQFKATLPTLRRVPKGARLTMAQTMSSVIDRVITANDEISWQRLLLFPYAVLEVPRKCDHVKNLTKWVRDKVDRWNDNFFEPSPRTRYENHATRMHDSETALAKKIEAKLADGDVKGAVRLATSQETVASASKDTLRALEAKHPDHSPPLQHLPSPHTVPTCPPTEEKEISSAISSFYPGSAGGLDGLRPQILKDLTSKSLGQIASQLLGSIQRLMDLILANKVPISISPLLFGASLTALQKKDGGIRPIAVGMSWRRLSSKIVVSRISPIVKDLTHPHQLGVGVKGGSEGGAHSARRYWNYPHSSPKLFLKLDFKNAFNELRRDSLLLAANTHTPEYYSYIYSCYAQPSFLYYDLNPILSRRGLQQGDPLGPTLFSITVQPIVNAINTELNVWYLDDGTIADSVESVLNTLPLIREMSENIGLHLNESKCEAYILGASEEETETIVSRIHQEAPDIKVMGSTEATLLGAPLSDTAIDSVLDMKTNALYVMSKRLQYLSSHTAFYLLRASVSIPRLVYFLRCSPTWRCSSSLLRFDSVLKDALEMILNCSLPETSWSQSSLPVKHGGLGVKHATDISIPCFLASNYSVKDLINMLVPPYMRNDQAVEEGETLWNSNTSCELPPINERAKQASWEFPHIQNVLRSLQDSAGSRQDKARLLAIQQPDASSWLHALPSPQLGTYLSDESFRVCCALRLGGDVCQTHVCPCGEWVDGKGYHGLSCRMSSGRRSRHERANDIISRTLRLAEVPNIREPAGCSRSDGKRPDGLTLIPWARGKSLVWDFTCADTLAPSYLNDTVKVSGAAAEKAERKKLAKYEFLSERYTFIPVAIESFGVWGALGKKFIEDLASRLQKVTEDRRSRSFLKQRLSLAIQEGNAASVLGTLPRGKSFDEVFLL